MQQIYRRRPVFYEHLRVAASVAYFQESLTAPNKDKNYITHIKDHRFPNRKTTCLQLSKKVTKVIFVSSLDAIIFQAYFL